MVEVTEALAQLVKVPAGTVMVAVADDCVWVDLA